MINLLADSHKREIKAGRINVILVRYISILAVALLIIASITVGSFIVLKSAEMNAQSKTNDNDLKVAAYNQTKVAADQFRNDLSTAKNILDKEVTYSALIHEITDTIPNGIVIDALDLDSTTLGTPITINANGRSYQDGVRLKNEFQKNTKLYSDVSLASINASDGEAGDYPYKIVLNVTINKGAIL